jgi:SM-20-related protein
MVGLEDRLVADLSEKGWSVSPSFLDGAGVAAWSEEVRTKLASGEFRHAGVGRGSTFRIDPEVRNDRVRWIDPGESSAIETGYLERMDAMRHVLNEELYLGLGGFEAHLAVFPPEARYRCHLDQFRHALHRVVSAILYLNEDWDESDGGALRLYLEEPESAPYEDIFPVGGTVVSFLSARFHHEVLPARKPRMSATGWFTRHP